MSFSKIMMMIEHLNVKIQTVAKSVGKKTEEMKQKKISLNRLNSQIQKQSWITLIIHFKPKSIISLLIFLF